MSLEAVVLTGGKSRRMGQDKAKISIGGVPQAERIVRDLLGAGIPVTILGSEPIEGAAFLKDKAEYAGPISALKEFIPKADFVFVASCDLPLFDARVVRFLHVRIGEHDAVTPEVDGFRQPLCTLYKASTFSKLESLADQCVMGWLDAIDALVISEQELTDEGLRPAVARGANTPEELEMMLAEGGK